MAKSCTFQSDHLEDRISQLPNEVLLDILSLLTFQEAGRTSVLAKRWQDLWKFTGRLNFDGSKAQNEIDRLLRGATRKKKQNLLTSKYLSWVNQVVRSHQGDSIDEFILKFGLDASSTSNIDEWLKFMVQKRAKAIVIDILPVYFGVYYTPSQECYNYITSVSNISNIACLTSLSLKRVNIDEGLLEYFLSKCPHLEMLYLSLSDRIVNLKVAGPSIALKYLEVKRCNSLKSVELYAPRLVTFSYFGHKVSFFIGSSPLLTDFRIGAGSNEEVTYALVPISTHLAHLETLTLEMVIQAPSFDLPQFGKLGNLKHLTLDLYLERDMSLLMFTKLIVAAPALPKFTLKLKWFMILKLETEELPVQPHTCLKEVEIFGFMGGWGDFELAKYLLKNAINLEKMVIGPFHPKDVGGCRKDPHKRVWKIHKDAQVLEKILPSGAELVVIETE